MLRYEPRTLRGLLNSLRGGSDMRPVSSTVSSSRAGLRRVSNTVSGKADPELVSKPHLRTRVRQHLHARGRQHVRTRAIALPLKLLTQRHPVCRRHSRTQRRVRCLALRRRHHVESGRVEKRPYLNTASGGADPRRLSVVSDAFDPRRNNAICDPQRWAESRLCAGVHVRASIRVRRTANRADTPWQQDLVSQLDD